MEVIKCPVCGNEKCREVSNDKYVCLACDNVFLIHNLSKEFRETDQHLSAVHEDLKQTLQDGFGKSGEIQLKENLENAAKMLELGEYELAYSKYDEISKENPKLSETWIGKYKAMTHNYTAYDKYATFLCGGKYLNEEEEGLYFTGNVDVKNALLCSDCDSEKVKEEVYEFLKKCHDYAQRDLVKRYDSCKKDSDEYYADDKLQRRIGLVVNMLALVKNLAPAAIVGGVAYFLVSNWIQTEEFFNLLLSFVVGIGGIVLVIKLLIWGVPNAIEDVSINRKVYRGDWDVINGIREDRNYILNMMGNYTILSEDIDDKEEFMKKFMDKNGYVNLFTREDDFWGDEIGDDVRELVYNTMGDIRNMMETEEQ